MGEPLHTEPMVKYQFQVDDEKWQAWKNTVPRSKSLEDRIIELIEADTEGRVRETETGQENAHDKPVGNVSHKSEDKERATAEEEVDRDTLRDELAGSGDLLERRVDEVVKMYEFLRDRGEATKSDLLEVVDVDASGYEDENSVWANMVKGKDTLRALPGVETPAPGKSNWRFSGDTDD